LTDDHRDAIASSLAFAQICANRAKIASLKPPAENYFSPVSHADIGASGARTGQLCEAPSAQRENFPHIRVFTQMRRCNLCNILHNMAAGRVFVGVAGTMTDARARDNVLCCHQRLDVWTSI
jgi:hypothetical protein